MADHPVADRAPEPSEASTRTFWEALRKELTEKRLVVAIGGAFAAVLTALGRQLTDSLLLWQVVQSLFTGEVVVAIPLWLARVMRPKAGWPLTALVMLVSAGVLSLLGSLLTAKHVGAGPDLERNLALEARLASTFPRKLTDTRYNEIRVLGPPLVFTNRSTHVLFDFRWTKRDLAPRVYVGKVELMAEHYITTTKEVSRGPFVVLEMSLAPKQGWMPYFLGWLEVPLILAETENFAVSMSRQLP